MAKLKARFIIDSDAFTIPDGLKKPIPYSETSLDEDLEINVVFSEPERQMLLLALATLSLERPGWDEYLNTIAAKMDNINGGRAALYDQYRTIGNPKK